MTNRSDITYTQAGRFTVVATANEASGPNSPRVNGKLQLRANALTSRRGRVIHNSWPIEAVYRPSSVTSDYTPRYTSVLDLATTRAKEKWNGKLRDGSASLGVTLAQYSQTRDMVGEKLKMMHKLVDVDLASMAKRRVTLRRDLHRRAAVNGVTPAAELRQTLASRYLEGIFGWAPLIQDSVALCGSVFEKAIPPVELSSHSTKHVDFRNDTAGRMNTSMHTVKVTCHGFVHINNPNENLLARTGLTDFAGVLWDVIPWSFVAGMFMNVGAMLSDIRGFPGVTIANTSTTTTVTTLTSERSWSTGSGTPWSGDFRCIAISKNRTLGLPTVGFRFKTPDMSMGLAAMSLALLTQKLGATSRLLL